MRARGHSEEEAMFTRSFAPQYTGLILIILVFVIGASVGGPKGAKPVGDGHSEAQSPKPVEYVTSGVIEYPDLFRVDDGGVDGDKADALAAFITNHDIQGEFEVTVSDGEMSSLDIPSEGRIAVALERSVALTRALLDRGVSLHYFRVLASEKPGKFQARGTFRREVM
jgi:hypothetical protein